MNLDIEVVNPLVALIAGILILLMPLIAIGLLGLAQHFHS